MPTARRTAAVAAGVTGLAVLAVIAAAPALAHVTANAPGATQGGYSTVTFQVPTESNKASTTALKVQLPVDNPIASVAQDAAPFNVNVSGSDDGGVYQWSATPGTGVQSVSVNGGQGTATSCGSSRPVAEG